MIPPGGADGSAVQGELFYAMRTWKAESGDAGLLLQDVFVKLGGDSIVAPDIAWWQGSRRPPIAQGALDVVPDFVIEVLSPATRANDLGPKRVAYGTAEVRELWLLDPVSKEVIVCTEEGLRTEERFDSGGSVRSATADGLVIELDRIFV